MGATFSFTRKSENFADIHGSVKPTHGPREWMQMGMVLTWTFIYNLLRPVDQKPSGNAVPSAGSSSVGSPHSSDFGEFQAGLHHNEFQDIGFSNQVMANNWNASASNFAKPQVPPPFDPQPQSRLL